MSAPARLRRAGIRLHGTPGTRRVVPAPAAFAAARAYAAYARRTRARRWEDLRAYHELLLEHTPHRGQEEAMAERGLAEFLINLEIFWRPWRMTRGEVAGIEHYRAAAAGGRGVVTAFPHFGMPYAQFPIMRRYGIPAWVIASPHHYEDLGDGYDGRFTRQGRAYVDMLGAGRGIPRGNVFETAAGVLRDGGTMSVAFDVVGSMPTPFLGRTVSLASGTARLAKAGDAVVAPFVIRRRGSLPVLTFGPPVDSRDHADEVALQAGVARTIEGWALERPWTVWRLETQPGGPPLVQGPDLRPAGDQGLARPVPRA